MKQLGKYFPLIGLLLIVLLASCNQTPKKSTNKKNSCTDSIQASNKKVLPQSNSKAVVIPDFIKKESKATYKIDKEKSRLNWLCVTHHGDVQFKDGQIIIKDGKIADNHFELIMDSISDKDIDYMLMREVLVNTLKSEDFFDAKKFPLSTFSINCINAISQDSCEIRGNLNIKDITREIAFTTYFKNNDSLLIFESEHFNIDRTKWGITIYSKNFEQTDKSFLFTDFVDFQISMILRKEKI